MDYPLNDRCLPQQLMDLLALPITSDYGWGTQQTNRPQLHGSRAPGINIISERPPLEMILSRLGPLPRYSLFVGQCDDGLPVMLDLSDPTPGSILISGGRGGGKTTLLKSILHSAGLLNPPETVSYVVLSANPSELSSLQLFPHCQGVISAYNRSSIQVVAELASLAEGRKSGRNLDPVMILAIDHLGALLSYDEYELERYLAWLVHYGPRLGVWTIATLDIQDETTRTHPLLAEFSSHLLKKQPSSQLASSADLPGATLISSDLFTASTPSGVIHFWVPGIDA